MRGKLSSNDSLIELMKIMIHGEIWRYADIPRSEILYNDLN